MTTEAPLAADTETSETLALLTVTLVTRVTPVTATPGIVILVISVTLVTRVTLLETPGTDLVCPMIVTTADLTEGVLLPPLITEALQEVAATTVEGTLATSAEGTVTLVDVVEGIETLMHETIGIETLVDVVEGIETMIHEMHEMEEIWTLVEEVDEAEEIATLVEEVGTLVLSLVAFLPGKTAILIGEVPQVVTSLVVAVAVAVAVLEAADLEAVWVVAVEVVPALFNIPKFISMPPPPAPIIFESHA